MADGTRRYRQAVKAALTAIAIFILLSCTYPASQEDTKIDPKLRPLMESKEPGEIHAIITLTNKSDYTDTTLTGHCKIERRFNLIDAVLVKTSTENIDALARNPLVRKIFFDEILEVPEIDPSPEPKSQSNMIIGSTYVQESLNYTGRGTIIAIIDTGIDYTHPDLGGCIGAGCKVMDGFNFVDNNYDVMDDNGHGTHCAGIASANGSVIGVAPDSRLLAIKVCGNDGCPTSATMAGIDWAVSEGADVISISLGGSRQPNDAENPLQTIIEASIEKGVTVVVAAGNEGPGSGTIADIASARGVIAVGASDDQGTTSVSDDVIAGFSCRGPSAFGSFKPDVVAPGVGIYSTKAGGGYGIGSGTSMATPHVAGAAALLIEHDGTLGPAEIRSMFVKSARDIPGHPFETGSGLLNVSRAIEEEVSVSVEGEPVLEASVIPGMTLTSAVRIVNGGDSIHIDLEIPDLTDIEGDHSIDEDCFEYPGSVDIGAGEERTVSIRLAAPADARPGTYASIIRLDTGDQTLKIPVAITVPLMGDGTIEGSIDDDCSLSSPDNCGIEPSGAVDEWGDWRFYKLYNLDGLSMNCVLSWDGTSNDLDLYLFAPNGELVEYSGDAYTESESITLQDPVYNEYWIAVYAYTAAPGLDYDLYVSYPGTLSLSPPTCQTTFYVNRTATINYTIINDASSDPSLTVEMVRPAPGAKRTKSSTVPYTGSSTYSVVWIKSDDSLDLDRARYMNASLVWNNPSNDLDLYFVYLESGVWRTSLYSSKHRSDILSLGEENIYDADVRYYLETFDDVGIGIRNTGSSQSYTLSMSFTDESPWSVASVSPSTISYLNPGERRTVQVSLDTAGLAQGEYEATMQVRKSGVLASSAPLKFNLTVEESCSLAGDYAPCGVVSATEAAALIESWKANTASLTDVLGLLALWTG